jgi:thioredoxin 1
MATFQDIINNKTPVLVDFSAEWCQPCKIMAPILKEVAGDMGEAIRIIKVDIDRNQQAAAHYEIRGVPTFMLFREGKVLWRQSGVIPAAQLKGIIHSFIK